MLEVWPTAFPGRKNCGGSRPAKPSILSTAKGHEPLYEDVVRAVWRDAGPLVTGEEGRRALELVLAVYRSAAEGRPVALPLERGASSDYRGRFWPPPGEGTDTR